MTGKGKGGKVLEKANNEIAEILRYIRHILSRLEEEEGEKGRAERLRYIRNFLSRIDEEESEDGRAERFRYIQHILSRLEEEETEKRRADRLRYIQQRIRIIQNYWSQIVWEERCKTTIVSYFKNRLLRRA